MEDIEIARNKIFLTDSAIFSHKMQDFSHIQQDFARKCKSCQFEY